MSQSESNELTTTRVFDAPRELVWRAWTEPTHIARWWGPRGFTNTIHQMDVRPGGVWEFVMHGPDGTDYKNRIIYREVERPSRLVYSHVSGPVFDAEATFTEEGRGTRVTMKMIFATASEREKIVRQFGAEEGAKQTIERLGEFVEARERYRPGAAHRVEARRHDHGAELTISRELPHPAEKIWLALTDPTMLREWAPFEVTRGLVAKGPTTILMVGGPAPAPIESEVLRVEAPSILEYTWGKDLLRWELTPTATGTRLTLRHTIAERSWLSKVAAGWHICLDVAERALAGQAIGRIVGPDAMHFAWARLEEEYTKAITIHG